MMNNALTLNNNLQALALFAPLAFKQLKFISSTTTPPAAQPLNNDNLAELPTQPNAVLFGIGNGELLISLFNLAERRVLLIEPDLFQMIRVLSIHDLSLILSSGRLLIYLPIIERSLFNELAHRETLIELHKYVQTAISGLCWLNSESRWNNDEFFATLENALFYWCDATDRFLPNLIKSPQFVYDVTVVSPRCLIFNSLAACFKQLGHQIRLITIPDDDDDWDDSQWWSFIDDLSNQPSRLTIFRNRVGLQTQNWQKRFSWERMLPGQILSWWWDIPNIVSKLDFTDAACQIPSLAIARDILRLLPIGSMWLPAGALHNFTSFNEPQLDAALNSSVTFVGQSRYLLIIKYLTVLAQISTKLGFTDMARLFNELIKQTDWLLAYEIMEASYLECKKNLTKFAEIQPTVGYFLTYLLQMVDTGLLRLAVLQKAAQQPIALKVFGDDGWITSKAIKATQFFGIIDPDQLPHIYHHSLLNLNIDFMQSASAPNPKVLDIAACGGIILTNDKPELAWLYPDPATRPFTFNQLQELPELINYLMKTNLTDYRQRLRDYTLTHHTMLQRAQYLTKFIN